MDRFFQDHRQFLVPAHEDAGSVWKQEKWRQMDVEERAVLQGLRPALIEVIALQIEPRESDSDQ